MVIVEAVVGWRVNGVGRLGMGGWEMRDQEAELFWCLNTALLASYWDSAP